MQRVKLASALRAAIISIAFMRSAPVLADENKFVFVPQEDSPGNDYHRLDNSSFEDCAQRCDAERQCNAFTFNQLHNECFLKLSANRATTFYALATTGLKLSPSMQPTAGASGSEASFVMLPQADSPGNDYSRVDLPSLEECRHSCDGNDGCRAFTYNLARGVCFLKRAANRWTNFNAWAITGIKLSSSQANDSVAQPQVAPPPVQGLSRRQGRSRHLHLRSRRRLLPTRTRRAFCSPVQPSHEWLRVALIHDCQRCTLESEER